MQNWVLPGITKSHRRAKGSAGGWDLKRSLALDEFDHDPGRHWDDGKGGKGNQMALFDFTIFYFSYYRLVN